MMFEDRTDAAFRLIKALDIYKGKNVIIAGIPRGGMPMARIIADHLGGELTAVLVQKIPAPHSIEVAAGCVGLSGFIHILPHASDYGATPEYLKEMANDEIYKLKEREKVYCMKKPVFTNRTVILIDEGIATGSTLTCAIHDVRSQNPDKLIVATPVCPREVANELKLLVNEFVALQMPEEMLTIGQFYRKFEQVNNHEVIEALSNRGTSELFP